MAKQWTKADILKPEFSYSNVAKGDTLNYEGVIYTFDGTRFAPPSQAPAASGPNITLDVANPLDKGDTDMAAFQNAAADASRIQQERAQVDAQRGYQIGARDPRVEADKDAATRAAATFNQRMAQQSAASGAGAAVLASMNVQDPTATLAENRARADAQQAVGTQNQLTVETARQQELAKRASASEFNRVEQDRIAQNRAARDLSLGGSSGASQQSATTQQTTPTGTTTEKKKEPGTPVPDSTPPTEAAMNARIEKATFDIKDKSKLALLRTQGLSALKAYYGTPSNKTLWEQFRKAVVAAGGTLVNADPGLSRVGPVTSKYTPEGELIGSTKESTATPEPAPSDVPAGPDTPASNSTTPFDVVRTRHDPENRSQKPNPNVVSGIRTRF